MKTTKRPQVLCSLVAACLALSAMQANATTVHYNDGDLFLGFRSTDGTNDYLVDIGSASTYRDAAPGSTITTNLASPIDLANVFGANWYTRIDPMTGHSAVLWAVIGARQFTDGTDPNNTLYSTNPNMTPWARHSNSTQGVTRALIASMGLTYDGSNSTNNSPSGVIQADSSSNSYASFQPGGPNSGGISFQTWNPTNEGAPIDTLYFDRITPGTGASFLLGFFDLFADGTLTFTAEPVPDAVNTASLFAGALLLLGLLDWQRRKTLRV